MKKYIIIFISLFLGFILYVNSFFILIYIGNNFFTNIKYKDLVIKKPLDFNLNVTYSFENNTTYIGGLIPSYWIYTPSNPLFYIYDLFLEKENHRINKNSYSSFPALNKAYLFDSSKNEFSDGYLYHYGDKTFANIELSDSTNVLDLFKHMYSFLNENKKSFYNNKYGCNENYDCLGYGKYKNIKFIYENYNNEFFLYVFNLNDKVIKLIFQGEFNNDDYINIDKIVHKIMEDLNNEYKRLEK